LFTLERKTGEKIDFFAQCRFNPSFAALGEDGLKVAFEEGAGVLEVLFGVGFGGGDALRRFVEDADDPPLPGEGEDRVSVMGVMGLMRSMGIMLKNKL